MQQTPSPNILIARVLWGALVFSTFIYFYIALTKPNQNPNIEGAINLAKVLGFVSVLVLAISYFLPLFLFKKSIQKVQGPLNFSTVFPKYLTPFVLRLALADAVAIYGLVLAMLGGVNFYYPFWVPALLMMLFSFPTEEGIMQKANSYKKI